VTQYSTPRDAAPGLFQPPPERRTAELPPEADHLELGVGFVAVTERPFTAVDSGARAVAQLRPSTKTGIKSSGFVDV
jgi:hypothetical protein